MKKISILGAGNMGSAILKSVDSGRHKIAVTAASLSTLHKMREICPEAECTLSNREAIEDADIIVIAVKPKVAPEVIREIAPVVKAGALIVSVVAELTLSCLAELFEESSEELTFFRVIPNTAIRYGKSVTFISHDSDASDISVKEIDEFFSQSGKTFIIPEKDMAACTALASCGIAFFMRFIRAAVEGAVELGLPPGFATEIAAYTAEGAGELLKHGGHPESEIDKVTTPGGITIRGLNEMERMGLTAAVIAGLKATV